MKIRLGAGMDQLIEVLRTNPGQKSIGFDIGGSLIKITLALCSDLKSDPSRLQSPYGTLTLASLNVKEIEKIIDIIKGLDHEKVKVTCTGGGAFKYNMKACTLVDEMESLVTGSRFLLNSQDFDYLLVNVGSGISFIKVSSPASVRVGGSPIGGGTFFGLLHGLLGVETFEEMISLACEGEQTLDLSVKDIYGGAYQNVLSEDTVACFFGKMKLGFNKGDFAFSLLKMVVFNYVQLASLTASQHGIDELVFSGSFFLHEQIIALTKGFLSKYFPDMHPHFLPYPSHAGSIGALLSIK